MAKGSAAKRQEQAPVGPPAGVSEIVLVGVVRREAQKPSGDATPFSFLTVETEEQRDGQDKPDRLFHDVVGFGDVARHLAKAFDEGDRVKVLGRLQYRRGRTDDDPRSHRVVVEAPADIATAEDGEPHSTAVRLVGEVVSVEAGESKKNKIPYWRGSILCTIERSDGDGTAEVEHKVIAFDRAAVAAADLSLAEGDAVTVTGRMHRSGIDRKKSAFEPTVLIDDLGGGVERVV